MSSIGDIPVVWQPRCKICMMAKSDPELFKELHQQVLEVNVSMARAMAYINDRIDRESLATPKINNQNMSAHFNSHIAIPDRMLNEVAQITQRKDLANLKDVAPEVGSFVEDMVRRKVGNEVGDYLNLDRLRHMLMDKLEFLDDIVSKIKEGGEKSIDLEALSSYISVVKEIRGCIIDINKIRHSKQLVNLVVKSLIEKNTFEIVRQMAREYDQVKKDLADSGVDKAVIDRVHVQLGMRLAEVVATTARNSVIDVIKTYKLD